MSHKTRSIAFSIFLLLVSVRLATGGVISKEALNQAKTDLHQAVDAGKVAGGAHLVVHRGTVVHFVTAGYADIEDQTPFRKDTIVRIYSMTKPITSVAAMTLYEQGAFNLDDPVSKYIPAFKNMTVLRKGGKTFPPKRPLSVRDVFRHTTGYSYGNPRVKKHHEREGLKYRPPHGMLPPDMTIEQAAEALTRIPALQHPGTKFTYGFNTDILGRLVEIWSGEALDAFMQKTIFEPLEMTDTGFSVPKEKLERFASCHTWKNGKLAIADKAATSAYGKGFKFLSGGGGLVSTIGDYANFCQMMVDGGTFKGKRLLKEKTVNLMFTDQLEGVVDYFRFGLGFAIGDIKLSTRKATQYSWGGYASTDFRLVPEEKLFQIVMRQRVPTDNGLANKLFPIIYKGVQVKQAQVQAP